ncbi:MAG: hypothetical protein EP348_00375 [Alphaproteobacteria bacterium]|nr:MAG: hypothetical protein EP348_00375 [Alphaproteobacteria bacterium]
MVDDDTRLASGRRRLKDDFNPGGRPKGSKNRKTMMREIAFTPLRKQEGDRNVTLSVLEAVLFQLRKAALEGTSPRAMKKFRRLMEKCQPDVINENAGYIIAPAEMTPEEWEAEQIEKNKTRKPPPGVDDIDDEDD